MKEKFNEKVIPVILKFINTKGIQSIKNGMVDVYKRQCGTGYEKRKINPFKSKVCKDLSFFY